ncbi:hypothetical protein DIPPA_20428 [Diplonema papillatum]|nr:hypothetical protein DIPPA_20428 [Diplonema papillatum]
MRTREREREEADRAAAQAAAAADGIDAAAVVVTVDADPQPAPAPHGGEGASGEHAGDDGAMAADQTCSDQPLLSPRGGSVVCGSAVGAAPADEASDQRPNAKAASSLCCVCLKNPRQVCFFFCFEALRYQGKPATREPSFTCSAVLQSHGPTGQVATDFPN